MISIAGYQIIAQLYNSAYSQIYRAIRTKDNLPVILKVLNQEYPTPEQLNRYQQEYEITRSLNTSLSGTVGVVKVYGLEKYNNTLVMVLEDLGGESLKSWMTDREFNLSEFLNLAITIVEILGEIHSANIIHKDINPSNIIFNPATDEVKIIDFGIATVYDPEKTVENPTVFEGTLAYISPEQTGRMNCSLDYRTDFYSLGVTLYELLTHQLPFNTTDKMELVHCHIAKQPVPPEKLNPEIPKSISDIVMKLLAKSADDRYKSAWGIHADLVICLMQLEANDEIEDLIPGENDVDEKFQIPLRLDGRKREMETLLAALQQEKRPISQLTTDKIDLILVKGDAGIGKSALVQEIAPKISQQGAYFISGQFDQYRNISYSALIKAFRELIKQLLTESEAKLEGWRSQLLAAWGDNGQVIVDAIPELELIVGPQPAVLEISPAASENRFNLVLQNLIGVFAKPEHPLVIFLDNLQWADPASLKLIKLLMTAPKTARSQHLSLIGSYRDNEVSADDPLMLTINDLKNSGAIVNDIELSGLELLGVTHLICETVKCAPERAKELAELVQSKTEGNPFFIKEFLRSLYAESLLYFDKKSRSWQWDMQQIKSHNITENVVAMMADKMQKLTPSGQQLLQLAACIGNEFDLSSLAIVSAKSPQETAQLLQEAKGVGLVYCRTDSFPVMNKSLVLEGELTIEYKFAHERIQQAAYSLIPEEDKETIHSLVGQLLLRNTPPDKLEDKIFDIVYQLNLGVQLINRQSQRDELARLNLIAGKKAKAAAAYKPAFKYLQVGLGLLDYDSWNRQYDLTLALYVEATEAVYLSGDFEQMEKLAAVVLEEGQSMLDKVKVYEVKIQAYNAQKKNMAAVKTGLEVLKLLGVSLDMSDRILYKACKVILSPRKIDICLSLVEAKLTLLGKPIEDLINLPEMTEERQLAAMVILHRISLSAALLMPQIVSKQLVLSVRYGNAATSAFAYANYGLILCGIVLDIDAGYRFGELALNMLPQVNSLEIKAKTIGHVNLFIKHWKEPLSSTLEPLLEGYYSGLETGDLEFAAEAAGNYCLQSYCSGKELAGLAQEMATYHSPMSQIYGQVLFNLREITKNPCLLKGDFYDETVLDNDRGLLFVNKLILCYLYEDYDGALSNSGLVEDYLSSLTGTALVPIFHFYDSLTRLALSTDSIDPQVKANQKKMKQWAHHAPMNYLHKFYLVEAERCRVCGKDDRAMDLYDRAISLAKENEYINEAALGNQSAAKFYLAKGKVTIARAYMQEARYCYLLWGANAVVKHLEACYPQLLGRKSQVTTSTNHTTKPITESLDLTTVIKASQAISGEIVLDQLLEKLMEIIIENAGAQRGILILPTDGKMLMEAEISVEPETVAVRRSQPLHNLPVTVINYVERTRSDVVLSNAAVTGRFTFDPYIAAKKLKSLLCTSIVNGGKLIGILYLENNLTTNAFTTERIKVLRLLFSQAAISIENALLYANLEHKVTERTQEVNEKNQRLEQTLQKLKRTQAQLIQTEKMSSMGQLVAGVAHEINNPVSFIYGNIDHARGYVQDLLDLINIYQQEYPNPTALIQETTEDMDLDFLVNDLQKLLNSMKVGSERIRNIVLSLRNFSRLDESQMKQVDIHEGIESTLMLLQSRLRGEEGNAEIQVIKEYEKLPRVTCFASQLNQVFMNIIGNAIDALTFPCGSKKQAIVLEKLPTITISTEVTSTVREKSNWVKITIADNGPGMAEEVRQRIFDPFFTTKPVGSGTGLGLSISYQIVVEAHRGQLNCVSAPGEGTKMTISIPIK